jgi:hypothetical protein
MIILYPDRHVRALNIDALVQRALRGELYLLLEDANIVQQILAQSPTDFVGQLEGQLTASGGLSTDVVLACLIMAVDSPQKTIGAMEPQTGFILYCMLVYVLAVEPNIHEFEDLEPVAAELRLQTPMHTMTDVYRAVNSASKRLLGGIPKHVRLTEIKNLTERIIAARTGLLPLQHMVLYNFIEREKIMAQRILEAVATHPELDVHVVIGACHVTGDLSNEFISTLNVNVPSYVDLMNLIEQHYPGQRLVTLIGAHEIR